MGDIRPHRLGALLIAVAILAFEVAVGGPRLGDLFKRGSPRVPVSSPVAAAVRPSPARPPRDYGLVPAGIAVFWALERDSTWMVAFDWSGRPVGTLKVVATSAARDGQVLWSRGRFIDAQGDVLVRPDLPSGDVFTWAAGSDGVCGYDAGVWTFSLGERQVRRVRALPDPDGEVVGCSFQRDLALVTSGGPDRPTTLWWIRLQDGTVLAHKTYLTGGLGDVVGSPDLHYFAENFYGATRPAVLGDPASSIRTVQGGELVGDRRDLVTAFSADASEIATVVFNGGVVGVSTLSDRVVWRAPAEGIPDLYAGPDPAEFVGEMVRPGSRGLELLVVRGDGSTSTVSEPPIESLLPPG